MRLVFCFVKQKRAYEVGLSLGGSEMCIREGSFMTPSVADMRQLWVLLYQVFGTLFATTMHGKAAGNRFDALVVQFLSSIQSLGKACHPKLKNTIWVSKYGLLGLLRCRQHFIDYTLPHSLFEGGIEGEGMVKEL